MIPGEAASGRVLLIDAQWNKSVAAIRSLGRRGLSVTAGESTWLAAGLFSRHVRRRVRYPSPLARPEAFLSSLVRELRRSSYDLLLPMELRTLLLLSRCRQRFKGLCRFPFAPDGILRRAASKVETVQTAGRLGIPHPRSVRLQSERAWDSGSLCRDPGLPLVLKPDLSEGGRGLFYCRDRDELETALPQAQIAGQDYLAQEMIPWGGDPLGVSLLLGAGGELLAGFTHRRLREYPVSGGPSTLRESFAHSGAEADALRLLQGMGFSGPAMVEFRIDPRDGLAKLMEINPRFWGSLPLAILAGVDFPYLLYRSAIGRPIDVGFPAAPGFRLRNLLPGELLYLLAKRGRVARDFWSWRQAGDELLSLDDPGPVLGRLLSPLGLVRDPQLRSVLQSRQDPGPG
jgi:predicted ATP-grasp superfamily ATP-dependent carboligase